MKILNKNKKIETNKGKPGPNSIDISIRKIYIITSILLLVIGFITLKTNHISLPGKGSTGMEIEGKAIWALLLSFMFAIINMIGAIIDHYDKRNNEEKYKTIRKISYIAGRICYGLSMILQMIQDH